MNLQDIPANDLLKLHIIYSLCPMGGGGGPSPTDPPSPQWLSRTYNLYYISSDFKWVIS